MGRTMGISQRKPRMDLAFYGEARELRHTEEMGNFSERPEGKEVSWSALFSFLLWLNFLLMLLIASLHSYGVGEVYPHLPMFPAERQCRLHHTFGLSVALVRVRSLKGESARVQASPLLPSGSACLRAVCPLRPSTCKICSAAPHRGRCWAAPSGQA